MVVMEDRPRIRTQRLVLRAPELKDARRIGELANDWDVVRMTTRMPWPYPPDEARAFIRRVHQVPAADRHTFLVEAPGEGAAGMLGFFFDEGQRLPEVGYWLGRPYWGQGLATEALTAAMRWAGERWRAVRSGHFADNHASGGVLVKAGFLYTGEVEQRFSRARNETVPTRMMIWLA